MGTVTIIRGPRSGGIDWLRALAVISVAAYHFLMVPATHSPLARLAGGSWLGVDLFFVLSGYLVWLSYERSGFDLKTFFRRRAWRILPVYGVMLLLGGLVAWQVPNVTDLRRSFLQGLPYYLTLTHNYSPVQPIPNAWSIAVEEQFYLLLPLIAPALLVLRNRLTLRQALLLGLTVTTCLRIFQIHLHPEVVGPELHSPAAQFGRWLYAPTHTRLDGLWVGLVLGMYNPEIYAFLKNHGVRKGLARAAGVLSLAGVWWVLGPYRTWSPRSWSLGAFGFSWAAMACGLLVMSTHESRPAPKPIQWLSDRIYSLYVVQAPILMVVGGLTGAVAKNSLTVQLTVFGVLLGMTLLLGDWLFRFVEAPLAKRGNSKKSTTEVPVGEPEAGVPQTWFV